MIVARVPLLADQTPSWFQADAPAINSQDEVNLRKSVHLSRTHDFQEDKIIAAVKESTQDCDPSKNAFLSVEDLISMFSDMKISASKKTGRMLPNHRCQKCYHPDHWIENCALISNGKLVKRSTVIRQSLLVLIEKPAVSNAIMTSDESSSAQMSPSSETDSPTSATDPAEDFQRLTRWKDECTQQLGKLGKHSSRLSERLRSRSRPYFYQNLAHA